MLIVPLILPGLRVKAKQTANILLQRIANCSRDTAMICVWGGQAENRTRTCGQWPRVFERACEAFKACRSIWV
eukprot:4076770-Pyramimonas_sp.AAC.1